MHRFEEVERVDGVVAEKFFRDLHGFAGFDGGGEVHHGVDLVGGENAVERCAVGGVGYDERRARVSGGLGAVGEIVEDDDFIAAGDQLGGDDAADVAGAAGD